MTKTYEFTRTKLIRRSIDDVFAFFSDAANLERITPEFLQFKILSPLPIKMEAGAKIDYRLKLLGISFNWQTVIESFEPPLRFADYQSRGPYKLWHHTHTFVVQPDGVLMTDSVKYQMPLGPIGRVVNSLFVGRTLRQIFDYRNAKIEELLHG